jgi:transposase
MAASSPEPVFVGIDLAKESFEVFALPEGSRSCHPRNEGGIAALIESLRGKSVERIVMEATGGLEREVACALAAEGLPVVTANPRQVRDFAKATGVLAKTDKLDARVLAGFAALKPEARAPRGKKHLTLQDLVARRNQLVAMRASEKNRLAADPGPDVRQSLEAVIKLLSEQVLALDRRIAEAIRADDDWWDKSRLLQTAPGVAETTAARLLAQMPELGRLDRREAAALAGLAPLANDSGAFRGHRSIRGGRAGVRCALYMAVLSAKRVSPMIKAFYEKKRKEGKAAKAALTACMRKLLLMLNAMLRDKTPWREPGAKTA